MRQRVRYGEEPPMMAEIDAAFHIKGLPVYFSWGDAIYNPRSVHVPDEILAHEAVHGERQLDMGVEKWWKAYIADQAFRLAEEIPAHQAEYESLAAKKDNAAYRRKAQLHVAMRLRGPVYKYLPPVPLHKARMYVVGKTA